MVNAVAFLLAAKLFARCFRLPRRWFGCNLVLADNFPREDDEDDEPARWFWWKVADVFAKEEHDMFTRVTMLVFLVCTTLQNYLQKSVDIYSHAKLVLDAFALLREWCGILVWFSTLLLAFNRRRKRKAPNSRNKENRGAEEAKERYFFRDFPLNF